ncbi:hypothetical protein GOBAR_AA15274 [Gossypium barbadense]|uniref:SWIM-type domain-containing protein n=1 Tax=Gossypium barbadense TaxID=3634 RepID=A0A2P5XQ21_GOSBA|nr:hypothetical protein GOBAR_AA15274 [Gossypium barbadense]
MEAGYMYVEEVRKVMEVKARRVRSMNAKLYFQNLEIFRVQEYINRRTGVLDRSYIVNLRNSQHECGSFQTLRYPCAHVHVECALANLNVEQYIDKVYMLECTLRIWVNEFPICRMS